MLLEKLGFAAPMARVICAYQPWWRDSRLQLWGFTALMSVLLFVGSCLASFSNRGSLRKTHSCYVEWWHLIEKCENSMFLAICFDKQILLFWTNIPKLLCAASFHPSHQVFFWMELLLQWPTKIGLPLATWPTCFPGFFLIKEPTCFYDLCRKNIYPFSSHSSMVREGKGVENLQFESFLNHLGAQFPTEP